MRVVCLSYENVKGFNDNMEHAMTQLSKEQYRKLMKRPSMSELEDVIHRRNRIDSNVLEKEQLYVDKLVKVPYC